MFGLSALLTFNVSLLFLALLDFPYGYYQFLRLVVSLSVILVLFQYSKKRGNKITFFVIFYGSILLLYNPIFRVHLDRELWSIINIATALMFLFQVWVLKKSTENV